MEEEAAEEATNLKYHLFGLPNERKNTFFLQEILE